MSARLADELGRIARADSGVPHGTEMLPFSGTAAAKKNKTVLTPA